MASALCSTTCAPFCVARRPNRRVSNVKTFAQADLTGSDGPASAASADRLARRKALKALVASLAAGTLARPAQADKIAEGSPREGEVRRTDAEWRELLPPDAYAVLRQAKTEKRFTSPLYDEHRKGTFVCAGCDAPLFPSSAKYNSGTGWPSFYDALPGAVDLAPDNSIPFMARVEVRCHRCQGHLGHVFDDGPPPTRLRYCMNGVAMNFKPEEA